nr:MULTISPECIES: AraC family ligand binding domain-containing protein [Mesorhizobium]
MIARDNLINVHLPEDGFGDYPHTAVAQGGAEPAGRTYAFHTHHRAQLFQIVRGSLRLETERGYFIIPPERAVFVPSGVLHEVTYLQETERSYLFFRPDAVTSLSPEVSVIGTTRLLRELTWRFWKYLARMRAASAPNDLWQSFSTSSRRVRSHRCLSRCRHPNASGTSPQTCGMSRAQIGPSMSLRHVRPCPHVASSVTSNLRQG